MFLTNVFVVSGILYSSLKLYSGKPKRETLLAAYATNALHTDKSRRISFIAKKRHQPLLSMSSIGATEQSVQKDKMISLFSDSRQRQGQEILTPEISLTAEKPELSMAERKANEDLMVASVGVGLATAGALFFPPLSLLSVLCTAWVSQAIFRGAYQSLFKEGRIGINVLDTIFLTGTMLTGHYLAAIIGGWAYAFSRKLLSKTEDHAKQNLIHVFGEPASTIWLLYDGVEVAIPFEALARGDIVVAYAGETIPIDGTITAGVASVDQHILTGEAQPVEKETGDEVFASTVVLSGRIEICVQKTGEESVAVQIGQILSQTADFKNDLQSRGEELADKSAMPTLALGALILPFLGPTSAVTMLNACLGFYMRILGPLSMLTFLNLTSQRGILIKDGRSLQLLTSIDTVVFDKTGTLTLEQPHVSQIHTWGDISEDDLLTYAAAAEYKQTHPIAKAIRQAASEHGLILPDIEEAEYQIGYGIKVNLCHSSSHRQVICVGSTRFMEAENILIPAKMKAIHQTGHENGYSFVYVALNQQLYGTIELRATIRPEAKQIIRDLKERQMTLYIISGDNEQPTRKLAQELGIEHYFAETLPEHKANLIEQLQQDGKSVCFVGDGINDSIALKKANVSISLRGAASIATDTAQVVLMDQSLNQLANLFDIGQQFEHNMTINFLASIIPGFFIFGGVIFFHFSMIHSILLNNIGVAIGASNAILPLFTKQGSRFKEQKTQIKKIEAET